MSSPVSIDEKINATGLFLFELQNGRRGLPNTFKERVWFTICTVKDAYRNGCTEFVPIDAVLITFNMIGESFRISFTHPEWEIIVEHGGKPGDKLAVAPFPNESAMKHFLAWFARIAASNDVDLIGEDETTAFKSV
ncbi:hypothetical protein GR702_11500 [Novosphingobium sp. FGD1]|uniref:Uncharacterized protein n=1 Tax=Novosphingobium silvae TaxID=2692619 RepID=A0A7X4GH02_9SPHN|nr:hypothetical protein [Novosphingobium silvae]MYL98388.1 hypothetical protein [Novosphingobium silvae]